MFSFRMNVMNFNHRIRSPESHSLESVCFPDIPPGNLGHGTILDVLLQLF